MCAAGRTGCAPVSLLLLGPPASLSGSFKSLFAENAAEVFRLLDPEALCRERCVRLSFLSEDEELAGGAVVIRRRRPASDLQPAVIYLSLVFYSPARDAAL